MPYYKFKQNDILYNQVEAHPDTKFTVYSGTIYYNSKPNISGAHAGNVGHVSPGHLNLYEINVDRPSGGLVYPFVTKGSGLSSFKTVTTNTFNSDYAYGDTISSTYPLSSSIHRQYFADGATRYRFESLKTALQSYSAISSHYTASNSERDLNTGSINLISIPSIFYGSSIKKGTVDLKYYVSGNLVGRARDINYNGELIQTEPVGSPQSGSTVGVAMYNEGILILTGAADLSSGKAVEQYIYGSNVKPSWLHFASLGFPVDRVTGSLFDLGFQGTTYTPVVTMFARAPSGELNWSNNPTFLLTGSATGSVSDSYVYIQRASEIKNINSSSFVNYNERFDNVTYISSVGIYDKDKNLIAIAKMANPVKKIETQDFLFKLKLDI